MWCASGRGTSAGGAVGFRGGPSLFVSERVIPSREWVANLRTIATCMCVCDASLRVCMCDSSVRSDDVSKHTRCHGIDRRAEKSCPHCEYKSKDVSNFRRHVGTHARELAVPVAAAVDSAALATAAVGPAGTTVAVVRRGWGAGLRALPFPCLWVSGRLSFATTPAV